jgi:transcription elongation factor SPT6
MLCVSNQNSLLLKQFLSDKEPGEKVIRPSSRGPSFLTLTLKIFDGVFAHKEITEGGKDHKDITSLLRLGKTLTIDNETFEDLDEVGVPDNPLTRLPLLI